MANRYLEYQHGTTGLSATMQWEVIGNDGTTLRALATGGVTEPRAGIYEVSINSTWAGVIRWYDGTDWASETFASAGGAGSGTTNVNFTEVRVQ